MSTLLCASVLSLVMGTEKKNLKKNSTWSKKNSNSEIPVSAVYSSTNLLLNAPIILRQVGSNKPVTRSWIGEVKGCGAV